MAFGDIARNIADFGKSITNFFSNNKEYPGRDSFETTDPTNTISKVNIRNWDKTLSYSFSVWNRYDASSIDGFSEYKLQINPLSISQQENFSINITPTQGGVVSEHNGIVLRDLIISGTTGIQPRKGTSLDQNGNSIGGDLKSKTGYEEFLDLRNYFRAYAHYKKININEKGRNAVLVFINRKDNEKLIIEPISFVMERQSSKSYLYDYKIVCRIIGVFTSKTTGITGFLDSVDETLSNVINKIGRARSILNNGIDILQSVEKEVYDTILDPLRQVELLFKTMTGGLIYLSDLSNRAKNTFSSDTSFQYLKDKAYDDLSNAANTFVKRWGSSQSFKSTVKKGPSNDDYSTIMKELSYEDQNAMNIDFNNLSQQTTNTINEEISKTANQPRSFYEGLLNKITTVRDNAAESFGLGSSDYNAYAERTSSIIVATNREPTSDEIEILNAFSTAESAMRSILSNFNNFIGGNTDQKFADAENAFNGLLNIPVPNSTDEIIIPPNASIEDVAYRELGDHTRWIEIVQLNNLIPPYISETSDNVRIKVPGDRLLIPNETKSSRSNIKIIKENKYNKQLTETEKRLGIDIKLNDKFDFVVTNNNDFALSVGGNNAAQAFIIKLNINKGDLKFHKEIGINLSIGEKTNNIDNLYDEIVSTILQDPRFSEINNFRLGLEGGTVSIQMDVKLLDSATPVPISIPI